MDINKQVITGVKWTTIGTLFVTLSNVLKVSVLARFLSKDDFILLDEDKIAEGIKFNFEKHKIVTEGAAATSAMVVKDQLSECIGTNVVCLICGGNIDAELFSRIIS